MKSFSFSVMKGLNGHTYESACRPHYSNVSFSIYAKKLKSKKKVSRDMEKDPLLRLLTIMKWKRQTENVLTYTSNL